MRCKKALAYWGGGVIDNWGSGDSNCQLGGGSKRQMGLWRTAADSFGDRQLGPRRESLPSGRTLNLDCGVSILQMGPGDLKLAAGRTDSWRWGPDSCDRGHVGGTEDDR
jgi:hypothetical protein